jgi:hypothetical protein
MIVLIISVCLVLQVVGTLGQRCGHHLELLEKVALFGRLQRLPLTQMGFRGLPGGSG